MKENLPQPRATKKRSDVVYLKVDFGERKYVKDRPTPYQSRYCLSSRLSLELKFEDINNPVIHYFNNMTTCTHVCRRY